MGPSIPIWGVPQSQSGGPSHGPPASPWPAGGPAHVVGLDLGQARDPTALCVLKRTPVLDAGGKPVRDRRGRDVHNYDCVHLQRWALGTSYPAIVADVSGLLRRPELRPPDGRRDSRPILAVDASGVGRAVVDLFLDAKLGDVADIRPVTIVGGSEARRESWPGGVRAHVVAKVQLVSLVQAMLQTGRLKIVRDLPLSGLLQNELMDFRVKVTKAANEVFEAREGAHDDLVLAVAIALWCGEERPAFIRFYDFD